MPKVLEIRKKREFVKRYRVFWEALDGFSFIKGLSETGTKALAVEKIGPRRPLTRKRLIGAPGTNLFSLGQKTVFVKG